MHPQAVITQVVSPQPIMKKEDIDSALSMVKIFGGIGAILLTMGTLTSMLLPPAGYVMNVFAFALMLVAAIFAAKVTKDSALIVHMSIVVGTDLIAVLMAMSILNNMPALYEFDKLMDWMTDILVFLLILVLFSITSAICFMIFVSNMGKKLRVDSLRTASTLFIVGFFLRIILVGYLIELIGLIYLISGFFSVSTEKLLGISTSPVIQMGYPAPNVSYPAPNTSYPAPNMAYNGGATVPV
ncbi:hypothetical protein RCL1_007457 [Eukaryota sp. TZLM3-RCL]